MGLSEIPAHQRLFPGSPVVAMLFLTNQIQV